ncbi:hypothetical protein CRI94_10030 [Longibacter salinarum]|uniref:Uncharacterized protein n=1 Tax=Longibacter salinarum TaxID=1850348 RepID=A0A2A8CYF9_9BACT|nr:carbohydrate binding family 9 domain-containing protein [Longibacter salinarum]PEN13634.1 hypothetical protein CRI94_10030 [Longibacter salinarum]
MYRFVSPFRCLRWKGRVAVAKSNAVFGLILAMLFVPVWHARAGGETPDIDDTTRAGPLPAECPAPAAFQPKKEPEISVSRLSAHIDVDGRLDDTGWSNAAKITGFTEIRPGDQKAPPVCTEAWIGYDDSHLYVAFRAFDRPDEVRASLRNRDEIFQDDFVGIIIDPFGDAAQAYEIFANPLGIQGDLLMRSGGGEDIGFDIVYESKGRITKDGYVVEMAIPFSSLRFPDRDVQGWKTTFLRTRPRSSRQQFSWSTVSRDDPCFMCQFGTMSGLEGIRPSTSLDIIPSVVGSQSAEAPSEGASLDNGRLSMEPSMTVRYGITPSLGAEVTVNPDFSQVESDAAQVDVNSTFALSFPERRPFFQEGSDLFQTPIDVVYTRSINAPSVAAKTTGKFGRTSIAVLSAVDEETPMLLPFAESSTAVNAGQSASQVARVRQTFGENSFAGATLTDQRLLDTQGSGTVLSADAGVQMFSKYRLEGQVALSQTHEPVESDWTAGNSTVDDADAFGDGYTPELDGERFWGSAAYARFRRDARHYSANVTARRFAPTFRTPNGFQRRNDYQQLSTWHSYGMYMEDRWIERLDPAISSYVEWTTDGQPRETQGQLSVQSMWKRQTFVYASTSFRREVFAGKAFERLTNWFVEINSNLSEPVRLGFNVNGGRDIYRTDMPETGRIFNASIWATFQPIQRLVIQPNLRFASMRDGDDFFYRGYIGRAKTSVQITRSLSTRLVTQYNHFDGSFVVEPLVSYEINPFTVFYVGSTHDYSVPDEQLESSTSPLTPTSRQFFFKFQYLLRV